MEPLFTPDNITELQENEIFVFGSNKKGNHAGGAAKVAVEKFGAIEGQAEGLQGQSYAIPTLDKNMNKCSLEAIKNSLELLSDFSMWNTNKTFFVTKIGLGIAGFTIEELKPIFDSVYFPENIILPIEFKRTVKGVKAFNKGLKCRNFQYEENKEFKETVDPSRCNSGFHFCENPLDVLIYYPNLENNEYAKVEALGKIDNGGNKVATNHIKIGAKIGFKGVVEASIDFLFSQIWWGKTKDKIETATTGNDAHAATTGTKAHAATTGNDAHAATTGNYAHAATTGNDAHAATTGNDAHAATTGNYAHAATTGNYAHAATTGTKAHAATTGNDAHAATTGTKAHAATTGTNCISAGLGYNNKAKASLGSWLVLSEWEQDENYNWRLLDVKSKKVDGVEIKENTFYMLKNKKFVECKE